MNHHKNILYCRIAWGYYSKSNVFCEFLLSECEFILGEKNESKRFRCME